jgi:putative transposase
MIQTERHYIKSNKEIIKLCEISKELYNKCNYYMRKAWFTQTRLPDINELVNLVQNEYSYQNLHNTKTAKQTIRKCLSDWSNFKKALNSYNKDKSKFLFKPKPPKYKEKLAQVIFYNETIKTRPLKENIITPTNNIFAVFSNKNFKQVIITPKAFGFIIEISYEIENQKQKLNKKNSCHIDLGLNNLCSITSNQNLSPILINGRIVKSINQYYNKYPTKQNLKKRYFRLENYFHHTSKFIINYCIQNNIGTLVIGKNDGWKQNQNHGKKNNQNFQFVPFYLLLQKIQYKAELNGIDVIYTEESYTSKCSFFDNEEMKHQEQYLGKRKYRGLFVGNDGFAINADINGSFNIGRKVIDECLLKANIVNRSVAATPRMINPLKSQYI